MTGFFDTSPATTTQTTNQTNTANPWDPAQGLLKSTIGDYSGLSTAMTPQQQAASANLWGAAGALPNMLPSATGAVQGIFNNAGMIPAAYNTLQTNLSGLANPANLNPYQTPGFSDALNTLTSNITNQVKGSYAASGRSPSGAGTMPQTLARGLMQGEVLCHRRPPRWVFGVGEIGCNKLIDGHGGVAAGLADLVADRNARRFEYWLAGPI